ncbi:unnamed protein product [Linum tenue]|uniref:Uncharacterized protein n=1 Tax=Linum tenue TaxID=586396 RepID=A0AAV0NWB7_9ROSI|nr:unnamed protein product [Linum tenue]
MQSWENRKRGKSSINNEKEKPPLDVRRGNVVLNEETGYYSTSYIRQVLLWVDCLVPRYVL